MKVGAGEKDKGGVGEFLSIVVVPYNFESQGTMHKESEGG